MNSSGEMDFDFAWLGGFYAIRNTDILIAFIYRKMSCENAVFINVDTAVCYICYIAD